MSNLTLLERLIMEGRADTQHQCELIRKDISTLREDVQELKVWKAKVIGISAGISGVVTAIGWLINRLQWS